MHKYFTKFSFLVFVLTAESTALISQSIAERALNDGGARKI